MTIKAFMPVNDDQPIIRYSLDFLERPMLTSGLTGGIGGSRKDGDDELDGRVLEELVDSIKWEPHVDEADKLDYIVAVSSGVFTGLIDILYVGEFSFDKASEWGIGRVESFVKRIAKMEGYKGNDLKGAIEWMEGKHPMAFDGNTNDFGGGLQHHFRDFSHHFSIGGLMCSIFTQFAELSIGCDEFGALKLAPIPEAHRGFLGKNFHEKLAFGVIEWFFHMVSDMAGSSGAIMGGTGIPGPLVSFMKELSTLPFFKNAKPSDGGFRIWLSKLFNGTLLAKRDEAGKILKDAAGHPMKMQFDLRAEVGMVHEVGKQATPVLINQCVVRGFYFVRRTCRELKDLDIQSLKDLERISPEDVLPFGNRAVRRMITVSSGVFTGVDFADAAIRAVAAKNPAVFFLRINYVGVATFAVACCVDARAAMKDEELDRGETSEEAFERDLFDLSCLTLNMAQSRILHSLEHEMVRGDIEPDKHVKRNACKSAWLDEWSERITEAMAGVWPDSGSYFLEGDELYAEIERELTASATWNWIHIVSMEAMCFKPYVPLHGDNDKEYKGLKYDSDYLGEIFCVNQESVTKDDLRSLEKAIKKARGKIDASTRKKVIGAVGTVGVVAATGGLAFYFAPALAPMLAAALGAETAALSGASLTSASLAFLGGGALAAGGAGMAGGTALIAGGGALIGAIGGTGASTVTAMALATNGSYVHEECAKLLAYCGDLLIGKFGDFEAVVDIQGKLNCRIVELQVEIDALKRCDPDMKLLDQGDIEDEGDDVDDGDDEEISPKKMLKILNRSLKFMRRCDDELTQLLQDARRKNADK